MNKGILGAKDFPFGISLISLTLPLCGITVSLDKDPLFPMILGSMIGTLLTISNVSSFFLHVIYKIKLQKNILSISNDKTIHAVIQKKFSDAIKTPSISYEEDKIISMAYFAIILILVIVNVYFETHIFSEVFKTDNCNCISNAEDYLLFGGLFASLGLTSFMIYYNTKIQKPNLSEKISFVTINLVYNDLRNWELDLRRFKNSIFNGNSKDKLKYPVYKKMAEKNIFSDSSTDFFSQDKSYHDYLINLFMLSSREGGSSMLPKVAKELFSNKKTSTEIEETFQDWFKVRKKNIGFRFDPRKEMHDFLETYLFLKSYADPYDILIDEKLFDSLEKHLYINENQNNKNQIQALLNNLQQSIQVRDWHMCEMYAQRLLFIMEEFSINKNIFL